MDASSLYWWASLSFCVTYGVKLVKIPLQRKSSEVEALVDSSFRSDLVFARLRYPLPLEIDPKISSLFEDASSFVGQPFFNASMGQTVNWNVSQWISAPVTILTGVSKVLSQLVVLRTLTNNSIIFQFFAYSLTAPVIVAIFKLFWKRYNQQGGKRMKKRPWATPVHREYQFLDRLATDTANKIEISLFGFQDWLEERYRQVSILMRKMTQEHRESHRLYVMLLQGLEKAFEQVIFIHLIFKASSLNISLGTINTVQSYARDFVESMESFLDDTDKAFQMLFVLSSFYKATQLASRVSEKKLLELDSASENMKIEFRNVSFTYPGSKNEGIR
ncbi:3 TM domain-containing transmembrane protein [Acrasis kona]|uniref:3 TM domain-containing transmembrane protein n=1 Tax=Acrasis kona TaxID=1008807 RepID=A0AAW2Z8W0_9EUKA